MKASGMSAPHGVLLVNIGTPAAPETGAVRRYLREFLSDPRVIDSNAVARWILVNLVVAPIRSSKSAAAYRAVWGEHGSPLLHHSLNQRDALRAVLGDSFQVELGMRYGEPSMQQAIAALEARGVSAIVLVPLFPQYSDAATASAIARARELIAPGTTATSGTQLQIAPPFFEAPGWIEAQAELARPILERDATEHVLMSFHGLPERQIRKCDPIGSHCLAAPDCCEDRRAQLGNCYRAQCFATAHALASRLGLERDGYTICFQSRLGRTPWIQPFTDVELERLSRVGVKRLAVLCPAFVADCLETLEEIGIRAVDQWRALGGESLSLVPCANADPRWIDELARLVRDTAKAG